MGWVQRLLARPVVAHWVRAIDRYLLRMGFALAAGLTFYLALAIVPVLMVTFGTFGFVVTTWFPFLVDDARAAIAATFAAQPALGDTVTGVIEDAFDTWQTVILVGLPASLVFGTWWITRTRMAVRVMLRRDYALPRGAGLRLRRLAHNLGLLFAVEALLVALVVLTAVATGARDLVRGWLQLGATPAADWLLSLVPLAGTLLIAFLLFVLIFLGFPSPRLPWRDVLSAGALGGVALTALQFLTGWLLSVFGNNPAAGVFGSVIVLMLYVNVIGIILLVVAAWVGTIDRPDATSRSVELAEELLRSAPQAWAMQAIAARIGARSPAAATPAPRVGTAGEAAAGVAVGVLGWGALTGAAAVVASGVHAVRSARERPRRSGRRR